MPHQCTTCGRTFPDGSKEMLGGCPDCGGNKFQFAPSLETRSSTADSPTAPSGDPSAAGDATTTRRSPSSDTQGGAERGGDEGWKRAWPDSGRRPEDRSTAGHESSAGHESTADRENRSTAAREPRPSGEVTDRSANSRPRRTERSVDAGSEAVDADSGTNDADSEANDADSEDAAQANARSDVVPPDELPPVDEGARPDPERGRVVSEPTDDRPSLEELREELNQQFESIKIVNPGQYELNLMELYNRDEYIISLQEDGRYVIDVPDSWRQSDE